MQVTETVYDEILDLFARGASSEEILKFHPSPKAQQHARTLLARSKSEELTAEEAAELDRLGELERLMQLVKARARLYAGRQS